MWQIRLVWGCLIISSVWGQDDITVSEVWPHYGSIGGATRLTVYGTNFAANQFNYGTGSTHLGNIVTLVSATQTFDCDVHKDGSHETQIMCYTAAKMPTDTYYVKVSVDGVPVSDENLCGGNPTSWLCSYTPWIYNTPTIDYIVPRSGIPGTMVQLRGKIFTDRYGSNIDESTNGKTEQFLRMYVGPLGCELKDPALEDSKDPRAALYELALDSPDTDWGNIQCKTHGTSLVFNISNYEMYLVGFSNHELFTCRYYNASFILQAPFGRSLPDMDNYMVSSTDKIYMYQKYTEISSASPASGSTEGGQRLTVNGAHFDETFTPARVFVGGTQCEVEEVQDNFIVCEVAAEPSPSASDFTGNRGLLIERWDSTPVSDIADILTLESSDPGYSRARIDETYFTDPYNNTYVTRTSGYFVPPHTGQYQFSLQADDRAKMLFSATSGAPADKEEVIDSNSNPMSSRMNLIENKPYYMQIIHQEGTGDSYFDAGVKFYNTTFTSSYTGKADQEMFSIHVTSTVEPEVQILHFKDFIKRTETHELLSADITTTGKFRLGLYDVWTGPLLITDDNSTIATELNKLPFLSSGEEFQVSATQHSDGSGSVYDVTFHSKRGNIPKLRARRVKGEPLVTIDVTVHTEGKPDMETIALEMEGVPSPLFTISDLTSEKLASTLDTMFGARCPDFILNPENAALFEDFETGLGFSTGTRFKNEEAFCGRYTLKNPSKLYQKNQDSLGISMATNKMFCFAYKGLMQDRLEVAYSYTDTSSMETVTAINSFSVTFQKDSELESTTWYYNCIDLMDFVSSLRPSVSVQTFRLVSAAAFRQNADVDILFDVLYIGPATTSDMDELILRRMRPAMPNGAIIDTVTVTPTTDGKYNITLSPFDCGYHFPLFTLSNGRLLSGSIDGITASLALKLGGSGSVDVLREKAASPPVTGNISVTFKDQTRSSINISLDADDLARDFESIPGFGNTDIQKTDGCANFDITATMLTVAGDQPEVTLTKDLIGRNPNAYVEGNLDGGLWYQPIQGDMLRTHHTLPQVIIFINDVPTSCADESDCSFIWNSAATPTVASVSPTTGPAASITITGTGFDGTNIDNNQVTVGGVACVVTAATSTSITCTVGDGPAGEQRISVYVEKKGFASNPSTGLTFTYVSGIASISPTTSGYGGTLLTITGYGFNPVSVTVGDGDCTIVSSTTDEVVCTTPTASADGEVDVVINQGETTLSYAGLTYINSDTAKITDISPTTLGVEGGTVTLIGSSFGTSAISDGALTVGGTPANITSYSDTKIEAYVPELSPGEPELRLLTESGYALDSSNAISILPVILRVDNVFPSKGSKYGGTRVTVTGSGFSTNNCTVAVTVGGHNCEVESLTPTEIICLIEDTATTHVVTNQGTHKVFGIGYAYLPAQVNINTNDFVLWQWTTPDFVNGIGYSVVQVENPSSKVAKLGGFTSGEKSKSGSYKYRFTLSGTYNIWSGYVDQYGIMDFTGTVYVVDKASSVGEVDVKVCGKTAFHNVRATVDPVDSSSCQSTLSPINGCSDPLPSSEDTTKFYFAFWSCLSPSVTGLDMDNGTTNTEITISGHGFSDNSCQNELMFGSDQCVITEASSTAVRCSIDPSNEPVVGTRQDLTVRVANRGYALPPPSGRSFALVPTINSLSPVSGSTGGGTRLTITGTGIPEDISAVFVSIDQYSCDVISATYTQIVCTTPDSIASQKNISVSVSSDGRQYFAKCEYPSDRHCRFTYASEWTPEIDSISPTSVSSLTTFSITGHGFGTSVANVAVSIGGTACDVTVVEETYLECNVANLPAGSNDVVVNVYPYGNAVGTLAVTGDAIISTLSPTDGSVHGGTRLTISGNGFVNGSASVTIDGSDCAVESVTLAEIVCEVPSHDVDDVAVVVVSNGVTYAGEHYSYADSSTPVVSNVSPANGKQGDSIVISGQNFASEGTAISVTLDDVECIVTSQNENEIECTVGAHATGRSNISVYVTGKGNSNNDITFVYRLVVTSASPQSGSIYGGQVLTVSGQGFHSNSTIVTICGDVCVLDETAIQSTTQYTCKTPGGTGTCDIEISDKRLTTALPAAYTYDASLSPQITGISPTRAGTGGGTALTVTGTGFGSNVAETNVRIDGSKCTVISVSNTEITCETGSHVGSVTAPVEVEVSSNGLADQTYAEFTYIDVWSSPWTWGGLSPPVAGDIVVIKEGQTILLDNDTEILKVLLIQGGEFIFDEKDIALNAEIILVTGGGRLQVGTESDPFQHEATITLYGNPRSKELPIFGTKVLALREGILDLHGPPVRPTWTRLAETATAGSNSITLSHAVNWNVGSDIVIATTGDKNSQYQNEQHKIAAISDDQRTLTLTDELAYEHLGTSETIDGTEVEFRAEVGLLTRSVKVQGSQDAQWEDVIEACPDGFDPGEFATQTCFQGRFGEEIGSDQFGAQIMIHGPEKDTLKAMARISFIEVFYAGQEFRLGRYPVHFHLNGDMSTSYIKGCAVHKTFNRAINVHGSHNTLVDGNVVYDVKGGPIFLEDGIEEGNVLQNNLCIFARASSSLTNDDITPACFWLTNPNNIVQNNAAAGGTHFGYWYRMHEHPQGPSATDDVCPENIPLGTFYNNTAHSFGWFGLWIFPNYFPMVDECNATEVQPAVFRSLYAWNCDKGAEWVNGGALQFSDFTLVNNNLAGIEGKRIMNVPSYTDDSPMVEDSFIVAYTPNVGNSEQGCTVCGHVFPYGVGFRVKNVRFVNFDGSGCVAFCWTRIQGTCSEDCGGYNYEVEGLQWVNSPNRAKYAWEYEGVIVDKDGSASSVVEGKILPTTGINPDDCDDIEEYSKGTVRASVCPANYKFHRVAFNNIIPTSLEGKRVVWRNSFGISYGNFQKFRLTHRYGWTAALVGGQTYKLSFENAEQIKNISYTGTFYFFSASDYLFVETQVSEIPDRFTIDGGLEYIDPQTSIDPFSPDARTGDWEWNETEKTIKYLVHGNSRTTRSSPSPGSNRDDRPLELSAYKCFYTNCTPPVDPNTLPPVEGRPEVFQWWSNANIWTTNNETGYIESSGAYNGTTSYGLPQDGDSVEIVSGEWMVADIDFPRLGTLILYGVLEFDGDIDPSTGQYKQFTLSAEYIILYGGRLIVGWPDEPFLGLACISLRGSHSSPEFHRTSGPPIGAKVIGVFGGLDLFGEDPGTKWTKLNTTGFAGTNQITVTDSVTWRVDDEIVIAPTGYNAWHTETFRIEDVSPDGSTLTLNDTLQYTHISHFETLDSGDFLDMRAEVGLLTRNIKVIGEDYDDMWKDGFGARILVSNTEIGTQVYTGYSRLNNVEFYHTGQEGWTENYDARYSVTWMAVTVDDAKPSKISGCTFHHGFNTAIGIYGTPNLTVEDNIIHHTVGNSFVTESDATLFRRNLIVLMIWTGAYYDRAEFSNLRYESAVEAMAATNLVMEDNAVAGSERVGYHVLCQDCTTSLATFTNNAVHSSLVGFAVYPGDTIPFSCVKVTGFNAWKNYRFGLYFNNGPNVVFDDNTLAENGVGIFPMVVGPSAVGHSYEDKRVFVSNVRLVGSTTSFDCENDVPPWSDVNFQLSGMSSAPRSATGGMLGITLPQMISDSNTAPEKPHAGIMTYPAIKGVMNVSDVHIAHYGTRCPGVRDHAFSTNSMNDDGQHEIQFWSLTKEDVDIDSWFFIHRPNVGKINSADCIDMDCDGLKKALFKDMTGTLLGSPGAVISDSAYEWDGDPRHGLGDYRIPKVMLTELDGTRIPVTDIAPHKGIIRNNNCTWQSTWQAWRCYDLDYLILIIESLDDDTETRRISPVAILGDGYLDLINGPQDHGWCSGYTCRKRLSTFMAIVAAGKHFDIFPSSTTPQHMRFFLLNANESQSVSLSLWYSQPNRLDVYSNQLYVHPTNLKPGDIYILLRTSGDEHMPKLSDTTGTNFLDRDHQQMHFIIRGSDPVEIVTRSVIVVSFTMPAVEVYDFFGENIIQIFSAFFDIPASKVRIVDVVSASSSGRRRRRSATGVTFTVQIGNEPTTGINDTTADEISYDSLIQLGADILILCQLANTTDTFGNQTECQTITFPPPSPGTEEWANIGTGSQALSIHVPDRLVFRTTLASSYEGLPLAVQPKVNVMDIYDQMITLLGPTGYEWQLTASIRAGTGNPDAILSGNTTVTFVDGWANFTDLTISHMGSSYVLDFNVTYPSEAVNFTLATSPFDVAGRPLTANIVSVTSDIVTGHIFVVVLELVDGETAETLPDISWRGHTWTATVALIDLSDYGQLSGTTQAQFDSDTGQARFSSLQISAHGPYYLQFHVVSSPEGYDFTVNRKMDIYSETHMSMAIEVTSQLQMSFPADFQSTLPDEDTEAKFLQKVGQKLVNDYLDLKFTNLNLSEGSILVTFSISGTNTAVNSTIYSMCENLTDSYTFTFNGQSLSMSGYLTVNGESFYGTKCGPVPETDDGNESSLHAGIIAAICICVIAVVLGVAFLITWKCKVYPRTKTHGLRKMEINQTSSGPGKVQYVGATNRKNTLFEEGFYRDKSFNSIRGTGSSPLPPAYSPPPDYTERLTPVQQSNGTRNLPAQSQFSRRSPSTLSVGSGEPLIRDASATSLTKVKKAEPPLTVTNVDEN